MRIGVIGSAGGMACRNPAFDGPDQPKPSGRIALWNAGTHPRGIARILTGKMTAACCSTSDRVRRGRIRLHDTLRSGKTTAFAAVAAETVGVMTMTDGRKARHVADVDHGPRTRRAATPMPDCSRTGQSQTTKNLWDTRQ